MAKVVYVLGAGFGCSVVDPTRGKRAPLANDFFQVLLEANKGTFRQMLDGIRRRVFVDLLLEEIEKKWHLDLDTLTSRPFDIEECMTVFESELLDRPGADRQLTLLRAQYALRNLILMYLSDLAYSAYTHSARQFGLEVMRGSADVISFNYDTIAEEAIASGSGIGPKPQPSGATGGLDRAVGDEDLDASHLVWKPALAYGFQFSEVDLPIAGVPPRVSGDRYYAHPANTLYSARRVLKLHGSIDWLTYTPRRMVPPEMEPQAPAAPPGGIVLERHVNYWMGEPPNRDHWYMEPIIVPPQVNKDFQTHPFPTVWKLALECLRECETLVVIGYSFPATDFRTKRLFLEAFSDHSLRSLVVVNPDSSIVATVRRLTHHSGAVVCCDDLRSLYGLPASWFDIAQHAQSAPDTTPQ